MLAVASAMEADAPLMMRVATPFCGGMSRTSGLCGAVAGGVICIGLSLGRSAPDEPIEPSYTAGATFVRRFEAEFGSRDCTALTGHDLSTPEGLTAYRSGGARARCAEYVRRAAEISLELAMPAE